MDVALRSWWRLRNEREAPLPEVRNPTELKTALSFGALYAVVLLLSAWLADALGSRGVDALAAVSGMTDVDAISLSSMRLFALGKLDALQTVTAIGIAAPANTAFKLGLVYFVGGRELARPVALGLGSSAAGLLLALLVLHGLLG